MGDFVKLPPVIGRSLLKAALNASSPGGLLFSQFRLYPFKQQMRAADDAAHTSNINSFRTNSHPITPTFLSTLNPLSIDDVTNDPSWRVAPIVVTGNAERAHGNIKCSIS